MYSSYYVYIYIYNNKLHHEIVINYPFQIAPLDEKIYSSVLFQVT